MLLSCRAQQTQHPQRASCSSLSLQTSSTADHRDITLATAGRGTVLAFCCKATAFWNVFFLRYSPNSGLDINGTPSSGTCLRLPASSDSTNFKTSGTHQVAEQQTCLSTSQGATSWWLMVWHNHALILETKQTSLVHECCLGKRNSFVHHVKNSIHVQKEGMLKMPAIIHSFWTVTHPCSNTGEHKGQNLTPPCLEIN